MKNLSAFPRFPHSEALMILITLVVCLAGFTKAEVNPNDGKQGPSLRKNENFFLKEASFSNNFPDTHKASEMGGRELRGKHFFNLKNFPESFLDRPIKRQSDYFGDSSDSESEKESDGYGYDDDEYYHFNFKRNDETDEKIDNSKSEKEAIKEPKNVSDTISENNQPKAKDDKDNQHIEMLSYQESHPVIQQEPSDPLPHTKAFSDALAHSKSSSLSSLSGADFKDNSAINENNKERNKQTETLTASESKITEAKQDVKVTDAKDSNKLQDSKLTEDSEKKEKQVALKGEKDSDADKSLKENSDTSEDKEKTVKLTDNAKLKDSIDKISSSKSKVSENTKLTKEDKDFAKFNSKINSDVYNGNTLSEISSGASFVGNDYKDNLDVLKSLRSEGHTKSYGESPEAERSMTFGEYAKEGKESQDKLIKEKHIAALKNERNKNYEFLVKQSSLIRALQGTGKSNAYGKNVNYDYLPANNFFKKPWKEADKVSSKFIPDFIAQQKQESLDPTWNQIKNTFNNLPASELENTDYHKNYMKSLKKYKAQSENAKNSSGDSNHSSSEGANLGPKAKKKKRSKLKKRRSMGLEKKSENQEKIRIRNQKRTAYSTDDSFADTVHECLKNPQSSSQSLNVIKANKEETNLSDDNKYFDQRNGNRQRRKSSQKLEYEIKIINQKQPNMQNVKFSSFEPNRIKKETKTKVVELNGDKYFKKYPYSQVSRDELTKMSNIRDLNNEKKFKRKVSIWKRDNQKSIIQTRAVPSGYYSNRVKFGQKNYVKSNDKAVVEAANGDTNRLPQTYFSQTPSEANSKFRQRSWENNQLDFAYEPGKRIEENDHLTLSNFPSQINPINQISSGNPGNPANSLLLLKKDERLTKVLQDYPSKSNKDNEIDPNRIANILSQDKNYVVFKNTDDSKLRKNGDTESFSPNLNELERSSYANQQFPFLDSPTSDISENNGWSTPSKSLHVRSSNSEKNDEKFSARFHDASTISNLNREIDKFKDKTYFFQDGEQESSNNRYLIQEAKGRPDIVFSQDKLPDPIIINHEDSNKESGVKQDPVNSIYAISNNFRNLDQQTKKMEYPEVKFDGLDLGLKPSFKQAFPEAKSINSITRNGNEIIVLDLNGNPLKFEHEHIYKSSPSKDPSHATSRLLLFNAVQNLVPNGEDVSLNEALNAQAGDQNKIKMNLLSNDRAVAIIRSADSQRNLPESLHELVELPEILKSIMIKVPADLKSDSNLANKQTSNLRSQSEAPQNYNQLQDFAALPGTKIKKEIILSSNSFPEQSLYRERNLENVLQSIMNPVGFKELNFDRAKNLNGNQETEQKFQTAAIYQPDFAVKRQNRWSTQEKSKNFIPFSQEMWENSLKPSEEISNILRIDGGSFTENENESKFRKELAAASEKIHRLRREGMEAGKLRKTIEDTLALKETQDNNQPELKGEDDNKKCNSDDKALIAQETGNGKNLKSQLNEAEETKEGLESEKTSKSDYENNLSELFENLNANKNQKNSKENTWSKKKRMGKSRRKRFSKRDISSQVSKSEVQNKVVQSLVEDNDKSVYSLGLKRKLLSTTDEMEDSDSYSDANKPDNNFNAKEIPEKPVKNEADECIDQSLVKLFSIDDNEAEKKRARRSAFHSNFKREIDLDESMPNDFQNFLMTSLGGFGSQKREVVKKGEALWEGKDMTQDNYNQIVENGKDPYEDSALEKREVSSSENLKSQNYKTPIYYAIANQELDSTSMNRADKTIRSVDASMIKLRPSKFAEGKLPTQIRIQISNASTKRKKSSKPIMEENETTSTEMENLPKEKEFFDKNKVNPVLSRNFNKLRQHSGATYSDDEYDESVNKNLGFKRKSYSPFWWDDRIRKKSTGDLRGEERKAMSFSEFDENGVDSLVRSQETTPNADQLAQKASMITRLPQVETVYNPTQGANKAQIQRSRIGKTNSVKSKSFLSTKNTLQSNEASSYDDVFLKPYLKAEEMKTDKGGVKSYGDPQWKILNEKMNLDQESFGTNSPSMPGQIGESVSFSGSNLSPVNFNDIRASGLKSPQNHYSGYTYRGPSSNMLNSQVMFDIMKLKQQMKNHNGFENYDSKYIKPTFTTDLDMQDNMQKTRTNNWLEGFPNNLDFSMNKKYPNYDLDNKNFEINGMKTQYPKDFGLFKHTYSYEGSYPKGLYEKPGMDTSQMYSVDNSKENDYIDGIEDDYPEMDSRDPQSDDMYKMFFKEANKARENPNRNFYNYKNYKNGYKNPESDINVNGEENELFQEYEEKGEDEDSEDFSQLGYKKDIEPELSGLSHDGPKLQDDIFRSLDNKYYNPFSQDFRGNNYDGNMLDPNSETNNNLASPVESLKNDADSISGSNDLLKKANGKSNIFGKNLMKNLYQTDNSGVLMDKFQNEKSSEDIFHKYGNKLSKRKLNFPNTDSRIGDRVFYAAKILSDDTKNLIPAKIFFPINKRNTYYRLPGRNPFNAEFADGENDFDHESGEHGMRVNGNFVSFKNNDISQNEKKFKDFSEKNDEGNVEDVEENVEGGSEDNVLENIMGKYIMRKRIANSNDLSKTSEKAIKSQDNDKTTSDDSREHKIMKRSVDIQRTDDQTSKNFKKRWSSGHLTENNFRKYHKKNVTKKRHINDLLSIPYTFTGLIDDQENSMRTEKSKGQIKRSALDIFRKITNKDKDKRLENSDGRSAGFEPLLSLSEKSKGFIKDTKETNLFQEKQSSKEIPNTQLRSNPPELKAHYPNEGQRLRAQIADRRKGKAKELEQVPLTKTSQGPWKVELNSRYDHPDLKIGNSLKNFKDAEKASMSNQNGRYKAFLVISNNAAEQSAKIDHPSVSKFFHSESSSYWPKSEECKRFSTNHVRKRSLKSTTDEKDAEESSDNRDITKIDTENNKNNIQKENTALQNTKSFPEETSKLQAPQVARRSTIINRSFVTDPGGNRNWQFFSKGKLINRKSVFPPSSDLNNILVKSEKSEKSENHPRKINKRLTNPSQIIRDSRHINEETSEYHSQRIVDAILSQVSENSQFQKLIAPGLAMRTPAYKEGFDSKSKPKTEINFSDEFQSFLKKFVFDLENLAEQHVQEKMCRRIDDDLREFLQSLLIPVENVNSNEMKAKQKKYSLQPLLDTPQRKNLSQNEENVHGFQKNVFGDLRNKQHFYKKILEKYQNLSKDTNKAKNSYILQESNEKNKGSTPLTNEPFPTPKIYFGKNTFLKINLIDNKKGLDTKCNASKNATKCNATKNTTKCNATKCNANKCNATKNTTKCNATKNTTKCNATKNATKCNATKNTTKCNATKCNANKCNATKNTTKCNATKNTTKCNATKNATKCNARVCKIFKSVKSKNLKSKSNPGSNIDLKPVTTTEQYNQYPFFCFYEVNNPNQEEKLTTTPSSIYEKFTVANFTTPITENCTTPKNEMQKQEIILQKNDRISQSFELMTHQAPICSTTTMKSTEPSTETCTNVVKTVPQNAFKTVQKNSKYVRTKHSLFNNKKLSKKSEWDVKHSSTTNMELNRLGLGDAAGFQLKNQDSWVSDLGIGKTAMNVPTVKISEMVSSQQKGGTRVSQKNSASAMSVHGFKNPQTFFDIYSDYSGGNNQNQNNNYCYLKIPHILVTSYRRIFQPEIKSVDNFTTDTICGCNVTAFKPRFILVRVPVTSHAASAFHASSFFNGLHVPRKRCRKRKLIKNNGISKKLNFIPRFLTHHPKIFKEVPKSEKLNKFK